MVAFFITDFYLEDSVKSMERYRRSASGSLRIKVMRRDQPSCAETVFQVFEKF